MTLCGKETQWNERAGDFSESRRKDRDLRRRGTMDRMAADAADGRTPLTALFDKIGLTKAARRILYC